MVLSESRACRTGAGPSRGWTLMNPSMLSPAAAASEGTLAATAPTPVLEMDNPIAADLEEVERILTRVLNSRHPSVNAVVDYVGHYRGKRLRPVLLLLTARACGRVTPAHHLLGA